MTNTETVARHDAAPSGGIRSARTRLLLEAPILPTLLRLAAPGVVLLTIQAVSGSLDTLFVGRLGPQPLAGVSLVYPAWMLMVTMSAGAMGGGVASAIARALGARRKADADDLVTHSLVIALVMSGVFTAGMLAGGPLLFRAMGGTGAALQAALVYSRIVFAGAAAVWLLNTFSAILRGTGQMAVPAVVVIAGELLHVALAPCLIFGLGPFPSLGVIGAGTSLVISNGLRAAALGAYVLAGRAPVRMPARLPRLRLALFWDVLRVGLPSSMGTILMNVNVAAVTSLVGPLGTFALAGYGMGARLEYLLIPLVFGFGTALVTMVGTNVGAGALVRARRITWVGGGLAAIVTEIIGLVAALIPWAWIGLFSTQPEVLSAGEIYLRIVGPTYGCIGLGLALYFALQGFGRIAWMVLIGGVRLGIAVGGAWLASRLGGGLPAMFAAIALSVLVYGVAMAITARAITRHR
jgi:putative MATE family efflux protein